MTTLVSGKPHGLVVIPGSLSADLFPVESWKIKIESKQSLLQEQ